MAGVLKHKFQSQYPDGPDPKKLQPSYWNEEHQFFGGNEGDFLTWSDNEPDHVKWVSPASFPVGVHALDGAEHSGTLSWSKVDKDGALPADIGAAAATHQHAHSSLTDVGPNDHHPRVHAFGGSDHSGLVLTSLQAGQILQFDGTDWVNVNPGAPGPHDLVGSSHTANGLVAGTVLKALSSTTFGFGTLPTHNHAWSQVSKTGSSLADLETRGVAQLSDGANVALKDAANIFTANQAIGDGTGAAALTFNGLAAQSKGLVWKEAGTSAGQFVHANGNLYLDSGGDFFLRTNDGGTTRMSVSAAGVLGLAVGVKFPATQSASSDVNTLDDYEEGTWTPVFGGYTSESGQSYNIQSGNYIKIGKLVAAFFDVRFTNKGTISGQLAIKNLPFKVSVANNHAGSISFWSSWATAVAWLGVHAVPGTTYAGIYAATASGATTVAYPDTNYINNSSRVIGAVIYEADS